MKIYITKLLDGKRLELQGWDITGTPITGYIGHDFLSEDNYQRALENTKQYYRIIWGDLYSVEGSV